MEVYESIRDQAVLLLDGVDADKLSLLDSISLAVEAELRARLRPGAQPAQDVIITAGTLLCVGMMEHLQRQGLTDFTAGTLRMDFAVQDSALAQMAYRLIAPWCSGGVVLKGVRV